MKGYLKRTRVSALTLCLHVRRASYGQKGILTMLDRNRKVKLAPERFQECGKIFDVVISCEERVFDAICEGMRPDASIATSATAYRHANLWDALLLELIVRGGELNQPVHVINVEVCALICHGAYMYPCRAVLITFR